MGRIRGTEDPTSGSDCGILGKPTGLHFSIFTVKWAIPLICSPHRCCNNQSARGV